MKLAGKRTKCPSCSSTLEIPIPELSELDQVITDEVAKSASEAASDRSIFDDELFDIPQAVAADLPRAASSTCASCGAPMAADAVLCVHCGFHKGRQTRIRTLVAEEYNFKSAKDSDLLIVNDRNNSLELSIYGWLPNAAFMGNACILFMMFSWLLMIFASNMAGTGFWLPLFGFKMLLLFGLLTIVYMIVVVVFNVSTVKVGRKRVSIRCEPIPWPIIGGREIAVDDIVQVYLVKKIRLRPIFGSPLRILGNLSEIVDKGLIYYVYDINAVHKNGWRRHIASLNNRFFDQVDSESVIALENRIKFIVSLPEVPVVSTWYQRIFYLETTHDDKRDLDHDQALSAKSLWVPPIILAPASFVLCVILQYCLRILFVVGLASN